jgi:acyl dehydratase/NADP-dependent 3-hydroxy acid dehydrogenase YdfG
MRKRIFTATDQVAFEKISGDNNPLHMDPVAARRFLFGRTVVHGIHLLLWALDDYLRDIIAPLALRSIKVQFLRPIAVGEPVHWSLAAKQDQSVELQLISAGATCTKIRVQFEQQLPSLEAVPSGCPESQTPRPIPESELASRSGRLNLLLDLDQAATLFPRLAKCMPQVQIAVLLATTRLVGVECPGLNSVYFELDLSAAGDARRGWLDYKVTRYEKDLRLVVMQIDGPGLSGTIKAFVRPSIQLQPSYAYLKQQVANGEFAHQHALVVGGSRGLGEIAVKLLCAGGANVKFTYHRGKDDAVRLRDEIASDGGSVDCLQLDVLESGKRWLVTENAENWRPSHLYFFATPFIFSSATGIFSTELFEKFCACYVHGFANLIAQLAPLGLKYVLYPSSVALDDVPSNMGEYAAAKAAGEMLCEFLKKAHRQMTIRCPRLPRLATDQTVSLRPVKNADPTPVILNALRLFPSTIPTTERVSVESSSK